MNNNPFPVLQTDRLVLRQVTQEDASVVLSGYSDKRVNQFMSVAYHSMEEIQTQLDWYNSLLAEESGIWWGICLKEDGKMIGNGGFHKWEHLHRKAELGYWILPEYQGKGLAAEAISAMITHGFENMALHRIEAEVETENAPSSRILRKMGFELEGIKKECEYINGRFIDLEFWAKLNI